MSEQYTGTVALKTDYTRYEVLRQEAKRDARVELGNYICPIITLNIVGHRINSQKGNY
jgi:hypothetical protein